MSAMRPIAGIERIKKFQLFRSSNPIYFPSENIYNSFHHFRHFAACYMINAGVPLEVVMRILGHADVKSTLVYARLKRETLKDAMKVFDVK